MLLEQCYLILFCTCSNNTDRTNQVLVRRGSSRTLSTQIRMICGDHVDGLSFQEPLKCLQEANISTAQCDGRRSRPWGTKQFESYSDGLLTNVRKILKSQPPVVFWSPTLVGDYSSTGFPQPWTLILIYEHQQPLENLLNLKSWDPWLEFSKLEGLGCG